MEINEREVMFLTAGESPDFGPFNVGQIKMLSADVAAVLVDRGIVKYNVKEENIDAE
jgi:hypothetical protein